MDLRREVWSPVKGIFSAYLHQARLSILAIVMLTIVDAGLTVISPLLFSRAIELTGNLDDMLLGLILYAFVVACSLTLHRAKHFLSFMSSEALGFSASTSFFKVLTKKSADFFDKYSPTEIQSAQAQGQQALTTMMQMSLLGIVPGILVATFGFILLNAELGVFVFIFSFFYGLSYTAASYFVGLKTRPHLNSAMMIVQANAQMLSGAFSGMNTLQHFGATEWMRGKFFDGAQKIYNNWRKFSIFQALTSSIFGSLLFLQLVVSYYYIMPKLGTTYQVSDLVFFNLLLLQLNSPFQILGQSIDDFFRSMSRLRPFVEMWNEPNEESKAFHQGEMRVRNGELSIVDLCFSYGGSVGGGLRDVNFLARRGRINFITGPSGVGKTTLLKLIMNSNRPQSGRIEIDGCDVTKYSSGQISKVAAIVSQNVTLFNATLRDNVTLGRPFVLEKFERVMRMAAIYDVIGDLGDGLDTNLMENGARLSGGERQRIAIARALYSSPSILILDEASSSLDKDNEMELLNVLRRISSEVTIIFVTHRTEQISTQDNVLHLGK